MVFTYTKEDANKAAQIEGNRVYKGIQERIQENTESPLLGKIADMQKSLAEMQDAHHKHGQKISDMEGHIKALNDLVAKK